MAENDELKIVDSKHLVPGIPIKIIVTVDGEEETITIQDSIFDTGRYTEQVLRIREKAISKALIKLGWTPPKKSTKEGA